MAAIDTTHRPIDALVHRALIASMIDRGRAPTLWEIVEEIGSSVPEVLQSLGRLEANHGFVPHPGTVDVWVVHPFSTTPTSFFVRGPERGWWAPCIWCAFGVGSLVAGPVSVSTRLGGESEPVEISFDGATATPADLMAHFPIPAARAWENVHRFCASTLVFSDEAAIDEWCGRYGVGRGEAVPIQQVADLARAWYGGHLDPEWRKPTAAEAQEVFASVGLVGEHWRVGGGDERF